jgi:biopolymer transport protein ExbB
MNLVMRIKSMMLSAGAEWVMWLLIALSAVSISVIFERAILFSRMRGDVDALRQRLGGDLRHGRLDAARGVLERSSHPAARVALRGMERAAASATPEQIDQAMQAETLAQKARLERRLSFLGTLGSNAPFLGLFGTVIGVVGAFDQLGAGGALTAGGASTSSELVMAAIAEALVATAVGIGVAIPAVFAFNHFLREVKSIVSAADLLGRELLASLPSSRSAPLPGGA